MAEVIDTEQTTQESAMPSMLSVDMQVTPLKKHGKEIACAITGSVVDGGVIELGSDNAHTITFHLADGKVPGLQFVSETDNYPFSSLAEDCPKKGDQAGQFTSVAVTDKGRTLTVTADRGTDPIVHYALRFTDGDKTFKWDPIIINN
jgi:hypothetical protein